MTLEEKTGIVPIRKTFLRENYRGAIQFREGFIFMRVVKRRIIHIKPWELIDALGVAIDIPPNSHHAAELLFRDARNPSNDLLFLKTTTGAGFPWILHCGFGIWPPQIRAWIRMPESMEISSRPPSADPIRPAMNDPMGYIDTATSPYSAPTDQVTCVIPPLMHVGCEFYNTDDFDSHRPIVHILACLYQMQIYKVDKHPDLIADIASGRKGASFLNVGFGDHSENFDPILMKDWGIDPISLEEAQNLGHQGGRF